MLEKYSKELFGDKEKDKDFQTELEQIIPCTVWCG
jgi:hypothetical protein